LSTRPPRLRADAARNRQRLIDTAKRLFAADGDAGPEAIARAAGVGVGTLYRHFPDREALAAAVYEDELDRVARAAGELLAAHPPRQALRAWMDRFADRLATKRDMAEAMRSLVNSGAVTAQGTRTRLAEAAREILAAGAADGSLRADVSADDLVVLLLGICLSCPEPEQRDQAGRLMELLLTGIDAR
jgi:AcrR family transcriptional regulator